MAIPSVRLVVYIQNDCPRRKLVKELDVKNSWKWWKDLKRVSFISFIYSFGLLVVYIQNDCQRQKLVKELAVKTLVNEGRIWKKALLFHCLKDVDAKVVAERKQTFRNFFSFWKTFFMSNFSREI